MTHDALLEALKKSFERIGRLEEKRIMSGPGTNFCGSQVSTICAEAIAAITSYEQEATWVPVKWIPISGREEPKVKYVKADPHHTHVLLLDNNLSYWLHELPPSPTNETDKV